MALGRRRHVTEEVTGDQPQVVLLVAIDGRFGGLDGASGTGFHLDEAEDAGGPADEVELSAMEGGAVVAGDHDVALAAEVEVGGFFAAAAGLQVFGGGVRR